MQTKIGTLKKVVTVDRWLLFRGVSSSLTVLSKCKYSMNECLVYGLVLSLLIVVSLILSAVATSNAILIPSVKTAVLLGKRLYETSTEINGNLAFINNVKGLH